MLHRIAAILAMSALLICVPAARAGEWQLPPTHPDAKDIDALKKEKFTFLILQHEARDFSIAVDIDGKHLAAFDPGVALNVYANPLLDGDHHVIVTFTPLKTDDPSSQYVGLRLILGDAEKPDPSHALMLLLLSSKDGLSVIDLAVHCAATQPGKMQIHSQRWLDPDRKHLVYELSGDGDAYAGLTNTSQKAFRGDGTPLMEAVSDHDKLVSSKDYKPDGTAGAEVLAGQGFRRLYYPDGTLQAEDEYHGGFLNGVMKRFYRSGKIAKITETKDGLFDGQYQGFDEHGTVRVRGLYNAGQRDGTWIRYDEQGKEVSRSVFENGDLIKGDDPFAGPTTKPGK